MITSKIYSKYDCIICVNISLALNKIDKVCTLKPWLNNEVVRQEVHPLTHDTKDRQGHRNESYVARRQCIRTDMT